MTLQTSAIIPSTGRSQINATGTQKLSVPKSKHLKITNIYLYPVVISRTQRALSDLIPEVSNRESLEIWGGKFY